MLAANQPVHPPGGELWLIEYFPYVFFKFPIPWNLTLAVWVLNPLYPTGNDRVYL
jgi:hypothetical protein